MDPSAIAPETVHRLVLQMSDFVLRYAVALAAVGALTMALIEAYKSVFKTRDRYHARVVARWIAATPPPRETMERLGRAPERFHPEVYRQLVLLTTGQHLAPVSTPPRLTWRPWVLVDEQALFGLELEKMMGQIQDAADAALANPALYPELYLFLTTGASGGDVESWYGWWSRAPVVLGEDRTLAKAQADTYSRLRQLIRRRLDTLQLTAGYRWRSLNQLAAVVLGAVLLFGSLLYLEQRKAADEARLGVPLLALASLAGGVLAPIAKDLVVALRRVRSG